MLAVSLGRLVGERDDLEAGAELLAQSGDGRKVVRGEDTTRGTLTTVLAPPPAPAPAPFASSA